MAKNTDYLEKKSLEYRKTVLEIIYNSGAGHTGGSLSCVDILNVLYNNFLEITPKNFSTKNRSRYLQSTQSCRNGFRRRHSRTNTFRKTD